MTDEEMAEEYFKSVCKDYNEEKERTGVRHYWVGFDLKNAFLAGLKAGRPEWNKVADGDYPPCEKGNYTINVLTDCGDIAYYDYNENCWIAEPSSVEIDPPIAWCEIPKYTEE